MIEQPKQIGYRLMETRDFEAVHRLWTEDTPWGTPSVVSDWYHANPHPGSMAVVAVDENDQAVGQFIFMAAQVLVDGCPHQALRPIAPIVAKGLRFARQDPPAPHPLSGMYAYAVEHAREAGISLFYLLPNPLWSRTRVLHRSGAPDHIQFPLWSLPLPQAVGHTGDAGVTVEPLVDWDAGVDELWKKTSRLHPCLAVRDAVTMRWRSTRPGQIATAVRSGGELIGVVISQYYTKQWLICDLLVADGGEALIATLAAMCRYAEDRSSDELRYERVAILMTPFFESALKQLGFEKAPYDFTLMVQSVSPDMPRERILPERWYISAND